MQTSEPVTHRRKKSRGNKKMSEEEMIDAEIDRIVDFVPLLLPKEVSAPDNKKSPSYIKKL